jgi:hypothetical protein
MHNEHPTAGKEHVPPDTLEAIFKLGLSGTSPEDISNSLKLNAQTVNLIIADDPMYRARVVSQSKKGQRSVGTHYPKG